MLFESSMSEGWRVEVAGGRGIASGSCEGSEERIVRRSTLDW